MPLIPDRSISRRRSPRDRRHASTAELPGMDSILTKQVLNPENPFILVHSPLISNFDLSKIVDAHKKRREFDKNLIMTMGVGRGGR